MDRTMPTIMVFAFLICFIVTFALFQRSALAKDKKVIKEKLSNGMTLIIKEDPSIDIVATVAFIRAGQKEEKNSESGIANFTRSMLTKGTKSRSGDEIATEIEEAGGYIETLINPDFSVVTSQVTGRAFDLSLNLVADVLQNATFRPEALKKEKQRIIQEIKSMNDDASTAAFNHFRRELFGTHPYGKPEVGDAQYVSKVTTRDLLGFYHKFYRPERTIIVIAGNVDAKVVYRKVVKLFGKWEGIGRKAIEPKRKIKIPAADKTKEFAKRTEAAWIRLGYMVSNVKSKDFAPLQVLSDVLGGGMASRLFTNLRAKQGLAYSVYTTCPQLVFNEQPFFSVVMATNPKNLDRAVPGILAELQKVKDYPITAEELEKTKKFIRGSHLMRREALADQAYFLGLYENIGLGYDYSEKFLDEVEKVSIEDVQRVAKKYFNNYTLVILKPEEKK